MTDGFRPESWQVIFAAIGGAAAALTGLLFVAFSMNLRGITGNPMHLGRSRETLATLVILLMVSIAVLIPGQRIEFLGGELVAGGVLVLATSGWNQRRTMRMLPAADRPAWSRRNLLLNAATLAVVVSGVSLIVGQFGGLYWLLVTVAIYFPWAIVNAWVLVVRVGGSTNS